MKSKTVTGISICVAFGGISLAAAFGLNPLAKHYIEGHYPGVIVQHISWHPALAFSHVDLSVVIDKPNLHAVLPHVTVYRDKFVHIKGGTVSLTLDEAKSETEGLHSKYLAEDLDVMLSDRGYLVPLMGVTRQTDGLITAKSGSVSHEKADITFTGLEKRPNGILGFGHIYVTPKKDLPFKNEVQFEGVVIQRAPFQVNSFKISVAPYGYAENVTITGTSPEMLHAETKHAWINHAWLNSTPVEFHYPISVDIVGPTVKLTLNETNGISWSRGSKHVEGWGACNDWIKAFPNGLREPLQGVSLTGNMSFIIDYGDKPQFKIKGMCKASCKDPAIVALRHPFYYSAYTANDQLVDRVSGPGSVNWVPLIALPVTLPTATITMEDPGFPLHHGFIPQAFENSLIDNLQLGRFHRGGSTLTMQLAKNLWLRRDKTLGRKGQEFFLAQELESCFTKDEILELYLNVVEFAPNVYGIGAAAQHYFKKSPIALSPVQAFYLATILPRPRKAPPPTEATLAGVQKLMTRFASDGKIPEHFLNVPVLQDDSEWGN